MSVGVERSSMVSMSSYRHTEAIKGSNLDVLSSSVPKLRTSPPCPMQGTKNPYDPCCLVPGQPFPGQRAPPGRASPLGLYIQAFLELFLRLWAELRMRNFVRVTCFPMHKLWTMLAISHSFKIQYWNCWLLTGWLPRSGQSWPWLSSWASRSIPLWNKTRQMFHYTYSVKTPLRLPTLCKILFNCVVYTRKGFEEKNYAVYTVQHCEMSTNFS